MLSSPTLSKATAALALCTATAAHSRTLDQRIHDLPTEEWLFQGLNAADAATTISALHHGYRECNPILGHHPSDGAVIGQTVAIGILHAAATSILQDKAPRAVPIFEHVSLAIKAGAVAWNLHFRF